MPPTEEKGDIGILKGMPHCTRNNIPIIEGLKEYWYAGMDEGSKTRYLLAGIKTTALDSVKTQILCNAELRQGFAKCVVLFKGYIMQANQGQQATRAQYLINHHQY